MELGDNIIVALHVGVCLSYSYSYNMEIIEVNGIQLEGSLERRSTATSEGKLAVCLHPWSWLGGRMNDP